MKIYKSKTHLRRYLYKLRKTESIGFVPTMGALHEGHMSLIQKSMEHCSKTVSSIFVNPTQFNEKSDLVNYPRPLERDLSVLKEMGCDVVFVPSIKTIYPETQESALKVDLGDLGTVLEGRHRPGHFEGVLQVVKILLDIVEPQKLFLGQKDYQQMMVLQTMVKQLKIPTEIVGCVIIREPDGLAMSSRNARLSKAERRSALKLNSTLLSLKEAYNEKKNWKRQRNKAIKQLNTDKHINVEYLELASANKLGLLDDWSVKAKKRLLIAAYVGKIRLIDNIAL